MLVNRAWSDVTMARRIWSGAYPDTIASAAFGPTPDTPSSSSNRSRSAVLANPNRISASSRTCKCVTRVTSSPSGTASRIAALVAASR